MDIESEELQAVIKQAVSEKMEELHKKEAEQKAVELDAKQPHELTLENVLRYSGTLQETPYTRDTVKSILAETIANIEAWDFSGPRLNEDILSHFFSRLDQETKTPTTMAEYEERRAAEEAEYERQREAETATIF